MGRLIDEDMLMERLGFLNTPQEREENAGQIITLEDFDSIPTAYDVDKVVEELKENASRYTKKYVTPYGNNGYKDTKAISIHKAIEIVKQGVISDDVCEWKFEETNGIAWHCDDKCTTYNQVYIKDLKITLEDFECKCPYCGKKIKVVE